VVLVLEKEKKDVLVVQLGVILNVLVAEMGIINVQIVEMVLKNVILVMEQVN
jgi:hypothetical protein